MVEYIGGDTCRKEIWVAAYLAAVAAGGIQASMAITVADNALAAFDARFSVKIIVDSYKE